MNGVICSRNSAFTNLSLSHLLLNPLSANPTKWSNTLKQFVGKLSTNSLSVLDYFMGLVLKGLMEIITAVCSVMIFNNFILSRRSP